MMTFWYFYILDVLYITKKYFNFRKHETRGDSQYPQMTTRVITVYLSNHDFLLLFHSISSIFSKCSN